MASDRSESFRLTPIRCLRQRFPGQVRSYRAIHHPVGGDLSPMASDRSESFRLTPIRCLRQRFPDKSGPTEPYTIQ